MLVPQDEQAADELHASGKSATVDSRGVFSKDYLSLASSPVYHHHGITVYDGALQAIECS
jgi:hypothetical protein